MLARQHQRRAFVAAGEDEERRAERRDRFEAHGAAALEAGEQRPRTRLAAGAADSDNSPSIDRKPLHAAVAVANASAAVGIGRRRAGRTRRRARRTGRPTTIRQTKAANAASRSRIVAVHPRRRTGSLLRPFGGLDLLLDRRAIDLFAVAGQRALPGGDRFGVPCRACEHVAVVILDHRVAAAARRPPCAVGSASSARPCLKSAQPSVSRYAGLPGSIFSARSMKPDRFRQTLAVIGQHVAEDSAPVALSGSLATAARQHRRSPDRARPAAVCAWASCAQQQRRVALAALACAPRFLRERRQQVDHLR